jgi:pimeloyl-ACP methyl ester carboxylesterase
VPVVPDAYAPYPVTSDPRAFDLIRVVVPTRAGDVVVHLRSTPGAAATLLLHGAAGSWTTWTPMLRAAADDGLPVRGVVLVDLPGWGASVGPRPPLDTAAAVGVVLEVLDALSIVSVRVVGHSMGAFIGMHLAVVAPSRVSSVMLVSGTTFAAIDAVRHPVRGALRLPAFTFLRAGFAVFPRRAPAMLRGLGRVGLLRAVSAPVFVHVHRLDRSVPAAFLSEVRPIGFLAAARAGAAYDTGRWRAIACPVLAVSGVHDVFARRSDLAQLARRVPQARLLLLEECGHFAHIERPVATARLVFGV